MKILSKTRRQNGVGLIEILIVLVVLVIGWAAIAALQGKLISGTSTTKARNEALELAREKTEEMRNTIEKGLYVDELVSGSDAGGITGVNATFNRSWGFSDVDIDADGTAEDFVKKLAITVAWQNNEGVAENVVLNSIITFPNKLAIASYATGGTGDPGGPGIPNAATASEGPTEVPIKSGSVDEAGNPNDTSDDVSTGVDDDGNLIVYTGTQVMENVKLTVYGGVIHKLKGIIFYDSPYPYVRATSPSFCTTFSHTKEACGITDNSSKTDCAEYVCYVGGDCKTGGPLCPQNTAQRDELPDLNGGWWGKVGDFFPTLDNANQYPTICMGDSINVAARLYVTKRKLSDPVLDADGLVTNTGIEREGINTSFDCQDVMISDTNDKACTSMIAELTGYGITINPNADPNGIEDHQVIRALNADDTNVALAATNNDYDNGVFSNFCANEISYPPEVPHTYECTCSWNKKDAFVESVIGVREDGVEETGCCDIPAPGCEANLPEITPSLKSFTYSCTTEPAPIVAGF